MLIVVVGVVVVLVDEKSVSSSGYGVASCHTLGIDRGCRSPPLIRCCPCCLCASRFASPWFLLSVGVVVRACRCGWCTSGMESHGVVRSWFLVVVIVVMLVLYWCL